ncbi:hypothetical protein ACHAXS_002174 [Conticribra weissflogii]
MKRRSGNTPAQKKQTRKRNASTARIFLFSLILTAVGFSALSFKALKNLGQTNAADDVTFHRVPLRTSPQQFEGMNTKTNNALHKSGSHRRNNPSISHPVNCNGVLKDSTLWDPNREFTRNATKRWTITDPPFWISLHAEWFDSMRWASIMNKGEYYETGVTSIFHQILSSYPLSSSSTRPLVLDIGMNIGWFSLYSRAHGHEVAAFEPNPVMFLRMCESLEHNNWNSYGDIKENNQSIDGPWVSLWQYGLGAQPGVFNLTLGKNPGGSSFHADRLAKKFRKTMEVQVTTLDAVAIQEGWLNRQISLMKVDVEGFEPFVFRGGKRLLYEGQVENLFVENSVNNLTEVGEVMDFIYGAGFRIKGIYTVNGDPYHEEWWPTFNPTLEKGHGSRENIIESDQLKFLAKVTCNIWWINSKFRKRPTSSTSQQSGNHRQVRDQGLHGGSHGRRGQFHDWTIWSGILPGLLGVADNVEVTSKKKEDDCHKWSSKAQGSFTVTKVEDSGLGRGTRIVLHLKEDMSEYLEARRSKDLKKKHLEFIGFPIKLYMEKTTEKEVTDDDNDDDDNEE